MWVSARSTRLLGTFGLAVLLASTGCQVVGDLDVKELSAPASPPPSPAPSSSSKEQDEPQADVTPKAIPPKPGCTENRPGARLDCGVGASRSCCETAKLPPGISEFRTVPLDDGVAPRTAKISAFEMDVFEVTVGRFRAFVEAGGGVQAGAPKAASTNSICRERVTSSIKRSRSRASRRGHPRPNRERPIRSPASAGISRWRSASGTADAFRPTRSSRTRPPAATRTAPIRGERSSSSIRRTGSAVTSTARSTSTPTARLDLLPVGSRPKGRGRWGHEDLLGNVDEWMLDIYCTPPVAGTCNDCVTTGSCFQRTARGGDLRMFADEANIAYSRWLQGSEPNTAKGFRCVRPEL